jgi:hypothetical protein
VKRSADNRLTSNAGSDVRTRKEWGDAMANNATLRVLVVYIVLLIVGQAAAVGIGLMLDPIS